MRQETENRPLSPKTMRREIEHFMIGTSYGGNQDWFRTFMMRLDGSEPYETAAATVKKQIDEGYPIPTLILNHKDRSLKDYVWHWFLINGWDDSEHAFMVKAVTYGSCAWLDLRELWDTGYERRGGFVLYHIDDADRPRAE